MGELENEDMEDIADTQPLSQPVDRYELVPSPEEPTLYWARLYPARDMLRHHDLKENEIIVGRHPVCHVCLTEKEMSPEFWAIVSKHHFMISCGSSLGESGVAKATIKDLSFNGTFLNGQKVGKDRSVPLSHNDVISLGKPNMKVFYYLENFNSTQVPYPLQRRYDVSVRLGCGAFGEVSLVFSKLTGKGYAMKTIIKRNINDEKKFNAELKKLENEYLILKSIRHPNVIQLIDVVDCAREKFLILELMQGKDLYDRISSGTKLLEDQTKFFLYQIASGVNYLHSKGIVHRDLKPENILLANEDIYTVLKISDFGLSKILHSDTYMNSLCGTRMYVAPEVLISGGAKEYTGQVDVWSMGVILFVCLSGQLPFSAGRNNMSIDDQIKKANYNFNSVAWSLVARPAKRLVKRMMTLNPDRRIKISEVIEDPWLSDHETKRRFEEIVLRHFTIDKENSVPSPIAANYQQQNGSPLRKRQRLDLDEDIETSSFV